MTKLNILVCDDQNPEQIMEDIAAGVSDVSGLEVVCAIPEGGLTEAVSDFFDNVRLSLGSSYAARPQPNSSPFDGFDLVLIDNNLSELQIKGARLTAEAVAGYLRVFCNSPYVVSLNKNPHVDFDLKFLIGDYESRADLAINSEHLRTKGLWGGCVGSDEFCPWYWPNLATAHERRTEQIEFVRDRIDSPILGALGFPDTAIDLLPSRAISFLSAKAAQPSRGGRDAKPLSQITFWDHFRQSSRSIPQDERASLVFGSEGTQQDRADRLQDLDVIPDDDALKTMVARMVAAELDYWFRRDLLGPQEILVDTPHLQMRLPLETEENLTEESWNERLRSSKPPYGLLAEGFKLVFSKYEFAHPCWLPRPSFWWPSIDRDEELPRLREKFERQSMLVFCEDTRHFRDASGSNPPVRFAPEGGRPWNPMFVEQIAEKGYFPQSQFAS